MELVTINLDSRIFRDNNTSKALQIIVERVKKIEQLDGFSGIKMIHLQFGKNYIEYYTK